MSNLSFSGICAVTSAAVAINAMLTVVITIAAAVAAAVTKNFSRLLSDSLFMLFLLDV